ncbi:MAG: hypothetical protein ACREUG_06925 [Steroidobacteraceae bacterium]
MRDILRCARPGRALCRVLLCAGAALVLAGCHRGLLRDHACNKPQPYDSAQSITPLKVPPGIDAPDTHAALQIPALNEPAPPPRGLREPCLDEPPSYATPAPAPGATKRVPGA